MSIIQDMDQFIKIFFLNSYEVSCGFFSVESTFESVVQSPVINNEYLWKETIDLF